MAFHDTLCIQMKRHIQRAGFHLKNAFIPHEGNDFRPHAVRTHWLGIYAVLVITVKVVAVSLVAFYSGPARVSDVTAGNIISLTNQARQANGIGTLQTNGALNNAAQSKANNMLQEQYFAHVSPSNLSPWYWFTQAGYSYQYAGENLAIDFLESEDVISAWLASPSHRANLLGEKYQETGVAVVTGNFQGAQSILVVQMFGTPKVTPTTTVSTAPVQTPTTQQAEQQVVQQIAKTPIPEPEPEPAPAPPPPEPPMVPTIATPDQNSLVLTNNPTIVGQGEAGSLVRLIINNAIAGTTTVGADGVYRVSPGQPLTDGEYQLQVESEARTLTSPRSAVRGITVDTTPPSVVETDTYALFSIYGRDTYDVFVTTSDDAEAVQCICGSSVTSLTSEADYYVGQIQIDGKNSTSTVLSLSVRDRAGNETQVALVDTDLFTTGVAAATEGPVANALQVIAYSRNFLFAFLVIMLVLALMNVVLVWERQHHATIIGTLLVIYLTGSLLLI